MLSAEVLSSAAHPYKKHIRIDLQWVNRWMVILSSNFVEIINVGVKHVTHFLGQ